MDFLSNAEKAQIDQALFDVMDSLHRSPIKIFVKSQSLDIRQTNNTATYTEYDSKCIVRLDRTSDNQEGVQGSRDVSRFEAKFHIQHLIDLGLATTDRQLLFNSSESYLVYQEKKFRVLYIVQEDIAVRIKVEASPIEI